MLRWFHAIMPKEERFFELFVRHSQVVVAGAEALRGMLDGGDSVPEHCAAVMQREQEADDITRDVLMTLRRSFITPFDRGAIKDLITSMDNAIDQMQKTAKGIMLFDVRTFTAQQKEMGDAIVAAAVLVRDALPLLQSLNSHAARIATIAQQVSELEGRTDELHDLGLKELYQSHGKADAMAFIVGNEIYDHLEKVVDRFDDVGNAIHGIVLEHV
jgi:predicted phosphate transport protein (TIGR00153 family)